MDGTGQELQPCSASVSSWKRMSFQEAMDLTRLPDGILSRGKAEKRFMSRQPPWIPGKELPLEAVGLGHVRVARGAFGGVVYCMAPLAASRVVEEEDVEGGNDKEKGLAIHVRCMLQEFCLTKLTTAVDTSRLHKPWPGRPALHLQRHRTSIQPRILHAPGECAPIHRALCQSRGTLSHFRRRCVFRK